MGGIPRKTEQKPTVRNEDCPCWKVRDPDPNDCPEWVLPEGMQPAQMQSTTGTGEAARIAVETTSTGHIDRNDGPITSGSSSSKSPISTSSTNKSPCNDNEDDFGL